MNSKLLSTLSAVAIALIATAPLSHAVVYSPAAFNTALKAKVGTKKGPSAYNAAANLYKKALGDKKNKKNADKYAKSIVKILKSTKVVPDGLKGSSVNTLVRSLLLGYFKGLKFSLTDSTYNKALDTLLKSLPSSQKASATTSQQIYDTIKSFATGKGSTQAQVFQYFTGKADSFGLTDPSES